MDFGISKLIANPGETELTTTETTLGTPSYMAPEQLMSAKTIDHRADIWALGVVMYRLLSGRLPFTAETSAALAVAIVTASPTPLASVAPHVPSALAAVVAKTMERDPAKRPQDAIALGRLLLPFGSGVVPFEASVKGLPAPKAPTSEPKVGVPVPVIEATVVENATTESAWSHRGRAAPRPSTLPIVVAAIAGVVVVGAMAVGLFVVKRSPEPAVPGVVASSTPSATEAPPPPIPDTAPVPAPPPTAAAPTVSAVEKPHPSTPPKPVKSAAAPTAAPQPSRAPNLPVTPEKDPLHL
jgi:serine/threonine-protein kinase